MAIATALAIGAAVAGSALSASSQKKAASKAADAQRDASAQNAQVQREIYGQNKEILSPYVQRGNVAGNALLDFYGLSAPAQQLPTPQPNPMAQFQGPNPDTSAFDISPNIPGIQRGVGNGQFETIGGDAMQLPGAISGFGGGTWNVDGTAATPTPNGAMNNLPGSNSADAFKRYIENSDYGFKFGEGANEINSGYAGASMLQSGAAMKDLERFRQNLQSGYRNEWAGGVQNQMGAGLSAGSALAGVGTNYANAMTQNNNNLAGALGNAALVKGANNPFASALGTLGGSILGMGK